MWEIYCSTCGGTGVEPLAYVTGSTGCHACGGYGYFEFDRLVPDRTVNAVLEVLRSLPSWEGIFAEQLVFAAEEVGIPNVAVMKQYLKDHWDRNADPKAQEEWYRSHFLIEDGA